MTEPDFKMLYLGTASLLVEQHNALVRALGRDFENVDDERCEQMAAFADDFNAAGLTVVIKGTYGGPYGIFDREQFK